MKPMIQERSVHDKLKNTPLPLFDLFLIKILEKIALSSQ